MSGRLISYEVTLKTLSPVFIGNGKVISKKEYMFQGDGSKVAVYDGYKLYARMKKAGKQKSFEEFILSKKTTDLGTWFSDERLDSKAFENCVKYTLDCGDAVLEKGRTGINAYEFVKDPFGCPYVPGSSIKGMLRTIILAADIVSNPQKYTNVKERVNANSSIFEKKSFFLSDEASKTEAIAYRTLEKKPERGDDPVNDVMQGFIVSDSAPLSVDDLVLCQKIDVHTDGVGKGLPILRECLKPGTDIRFTITVDTWECNFTKETIQNAVKIFADEYEKNFTRRFHSKYEDGIAEDSLFLGGGTGFVTKTFIYPLMQKDAVDVTANILDSLFFDRKAKKRESDVSPHILKCTKYQGRLYQMGHCQLVEINEVL